MVPPCQCSPEHHHIYDVLPYLVMVCSFPSTHHDIICVCTGLILTHCQSLELSCLLKFWWARCSETCSISSTPPMGRFPFNKFHLFSSVHPAPSLWKSHGLDQAWGEASEAVSLGSTFKGLKTPKKGSPGGSVVKSPPAMQEVHERDAGLIPGWGRSSGEGNSNPLQYSCLENPMDIGAWWSIVHGVSKRVRCNLHNLTTKQIKRKNSLVSY